MDHQLEIYHLDCGSDCKAAARNEDLEEMQGYQIDDSYTFCDFCREWSEEMEEEYNSNRYR